MNADWTSFYLAIAGASATLLGLLFIAVQFNIETLTSDPSNRWRALARSTFSIYAVLFLLPLIFLIPGLDNTIYGYALWIGVFGGGARSVLAWLPVWRSMLHNRRERLWETIWLLVGPMLAFATLARSAYELLQNYPFNEVQENVAFTFVVLFTIVLRNSWSLLVEITYERKQAKGSVEDKRT